METHKMKFSEEPEAGPGFNASQSVGKLIKL